MMEYSNSLVKFSTRNRRCVARPGPSFNCLGPRGQLSNCGAFLFHVGTASWAEVCVTLACNFLNEVHAKVFLVAKKKTLNISHLFRKPFD
jgi:hypothetical protein